MKDLISRRIYQKVKYIEEYEFPKTMYKKLSFYFGYNKYHSDILMDLLKDYFIAQLIKEFPEEKIGMPSTAVDNVWHLFIIYTKEYRKFCDIVYGYYLDHEPGEIMDITEYKKDNSFFNIIKYIEIIKLFRNYSNNDLNLIKPNRKFYSILLGDYVINNSSYENALNDSYKIIEKIKTKENIND